MLYANSICSTYVYYFGVICALDSTYFSLLFNHTSNIYMFLIHTVIEYRTSKLNNFNIRLKSISLFLQTNSIFNIYDITLENRIMIYFQLFLLY